MVLKSIEMGLNWTEPLRTPVFSWTVKQLNDYWLLIFTCNKDAKPLCMLSDDVLYIGNWYMYDEY